MDVEYELSVKLVERNVLETELDAEKLEESAEYQRLNQEVRTLRVQLDAESSGFAFGNEETVPLDH